ncbi:XkdX family protein [Clostridium botulinum]|nr:XkdX family protein [Clostridium botulinum]MBY6934517.1 XkdX family protein [Clostridium botulinum]NFL83309.1 XkdX family protein [Clostridium botulinum]NFN13088.1 XkdX family protein [Clostridium botulinum]NFO38315.1 XkdX family protein [Clostridium botulinum]NFO44561.1 XkdX family protein [Clostridium botulinum]
MFSYIREYYVLGLYQDKNLDVFVNAKWISEEQKQEIVNSKVVSQ